MAITLYDVLDVNPSASQDEIKRAYRAQALKWHPDTNGSSLEAEERFKQIAEAYAVLSDTRERARYDEARAAGAGSAKLYQGRRTAADARYMFMEEMISFAMELSFANVSWQDIEPRLVSKGCPATVAKEVAQAVETYRKGVIREAAGVAMTKAIGWALVGGLVALVSLGMSGDGHYIVTTGLFGMSMYNFVRGLWFYITGAVPNAR